jgi:ceramide glucosyltransferase
MEFTLSLVQWVCLIPIIGGSVYVVLCMLAIFYFHRQSARPSRNSLPEWPTVTILKPVCGVEKNQGDNLRSACTQDYPEFQVVFSVQDQNDPAVPLLRNIQHEFGPERVSVVIEDIRAGPNGKINNLLGALPHARYDIMVISDSDVHLRPDYLKAIVSPLADPGIGGACTLYRAAYADRWFEKMELLTFNADFIPSLVFAHVTGASMFCLGSSLALRRSTLEEIGGLAPLSEYLVEDYEMGKRIFSLGKRIAIVPYYVDITLDYRDLLQWWRHQVYWDQNTRAARPAGFFASIVTRSIPFAFLFAICRMGDAIGLSVLGGAIGIRLVTATAIMGLELRDREGLKSLALLPLRDLAGIVSWFLSFTKRTVLWRGREFFLTNDGRLMARK